MTDETIRLIYLTAAWYLTAATITFTLLLCWGIWKGLNYIRKEFIEREYKRLELQFWKSITEIKENETI